MRLPVVVLGLGMLASTSVLAATATASFGVSVTVVSSCRTSAPSPAASSPHTNAISNTAPDIAIDCTLPTPHNIDIGSTVVSEPVAGTQKLGRSGTGKYHARTFDTHAENDESLPPGTHPGTVFVTISY